MIPRSVFGCDEGDVRCLASSFAGIRWREPAFACRDLLIYDILVHYLLCMTGVARRRMSSCLRRQHHLSDLKSYVCTLPGPQDPTVLLEGAHRGSVCEVMLRTRFTQRMAAGLSINVSKWTRVVLRGLWCRSARLYLTGGQQQSVW